MNRQTLTGEVGLILAIIDQAAKDIERPEYRASAMRYFQSTWYKNHISHLGLPPEMLPLSVVNGRKRGAGARSGPAGGNGAGAATGEKLDILSVSVGAKV